MYLLSVFEPYRYISVNVYSPHQIPNIGKVCRRTDVKLGSRYLSKDAPRLVHDRDWSQVSLEMGVV